MSLSVCNCYTAEVRLKCLVIYWIQKKFFFKKSTIGFWKKKKQCLCPVRLRLLHCLSSSIKPILCLSLSTSCRRLRGGSKTAIYRTYTASGFTVLHSDSWGHADGPEGRTSLWLFPAPWAVPSVHVCSVSIHCTDTDLAVRWSQTCVLCPFSKTINTQSALRSLSINLVRCTFACCVCEASADSRAPCSDWCRRSDNSHLIFGVFIDLKHVGGQLVRFQAFAAKKDSASRSGVNKFNQSPHAALSM